MSVCILLLQLTYNQFFNNFILTAKFKKDLKWQDEFFQDYINDTKHFDEVYNNNDGK